jgi:hypothetical protein
MHGQVTIGVMVNSDSIDDDKIIREALDHLSDEHNIDAELYERAWVAW